MYDYYLMSLSDVPKVIKIRIDDEENVSHTSLDKIDSITGKYKLDDIKKTLLSVNKIDNMDTELVIMHQSKYNNKNYIKYFPVLTKDNEKYSLELCNVNNGKVLVREVEHVIKTFFNKYKSKEFKEMADFYYTDMDEHILKRIRIIYSNLFNNDKREQTLNEYISYSEIRKFSSLIHYHDKFNTFYDYLENMNKIDAYIKNHMDELLKLTNSKTITGQMEFNFNTEESKQDNIEEMDDFELYDYIKTQPWDDPYMEKCFKENNFPANFTYDSLTLNDKVRAGLIDAVDFRYAKMKEESKQHGYKNNH